MTDSGWIYEGHAVRTEEGDKERMLAALSSMELAKADAKAKGFGKGSAGHSSIACPLCKRKLAYAVSARNGHMMALCETDGCLEWME